MKKASGTAHEDLMVAKLLAAGVDPETLTGAARASRLLCAQSRPLDGGCLSPPHHLDFQHLFEDLAREPSV